jgi:hypothetical protein
MGADLKILSRQELHAPVIMEDWDSNRKLYIRYTFQNGKKQVYELVGPAQKSVRSVQGEYCIRITRNLYVPLGVYVDDKPYQIVDINYNKKNEIVYPYYESSYQWHATKINAKAELASCEYEKDKVANERRGLRLWNGRNNKLYDFSLVQFYSIQKASHLTAEDLKVIKSWKSSDTKKLA